MTAAAEPEVEKTDKTTSNEDDKANTVLDRKLKKLVDSQIDADPEIREALEELSTFFHDNTLRNRRQLRGEIERRSLQINSDFLEGFELVKDSLADVYREVKAMNDACVEMQNQLKATKAKTRDLMEQTNSIQKRSRDLNDNQNMIDTFLRKYQLTREQEGLLVRTLQDSKCLEDGFFESLERAHEIHDDLKRLLAAGKLTKQTTALEVMDQMSHLQESGIQRLYRWTQNIARSSHAQIEDSIVDSGKGRADKNMVNLSMAMKHLSLRPPLFKHVMEDYCASRRSMMVRSFLDALTLGGPHGTPKPIELQAHDPLRYVGDMLAWLHQATPTESDNLKGLLKLVDRVEDQVRDDVMQNSLCDVSEGVCRPLRSRVEQILLSESNCVVLYKLSNLIRFYCNTIESVVPAKSLLIETLKDLDEMAYKQFISVLQANVQQQTGNIAAGNGGTDLDPSQSTSALLMLLRETLSSSSVLEEQQSQLDEIVDTVIVPLQQAIGSAGSTLPTTDRDVYMLNSLYQIHTSLSLFKFNDARLLGMENDMQLHLDTLTSEQTSNLIANLEIQPFVTMVAQAKGRPLSAVKGMEQENVCRFMARFDNFLMAPEVYLMPQIGLLSSSKHRKNIMKRSLQVVSASYKELYEAVMKPENGYVAPAKLITPKTPEQIDLLLQL